MSTQFPGGYNWATLLLGDKYRGLVLHFGLDTGLITPSHKIHSVVNPNDGLRHENGQTMLCL